MKISKWIFRALTGAVLAAALASPALAQGSFQGSGAQPVSRGGTGRSALPQNNLIFGNGTDPVGFIAPGTAGRCLLDNGTIWTPGYCVSASGAVSAGGSSVRDAGAGTLEALVPVQTNTANGAGCTTSCNFAGSDFFKRTRRSNSASAMSDSLPAAGTTGLINGTRIQIANVDASAVDTISAGSGSTILGGAAFALGPGRDLMLTYDLANTAWRAEGNTSTALLGPNNLSDLASASSARSNLGLGSVDNTSDATKNAASATLTNKTFDTAGAGNVFKIGGTAISTVTGTGAAVLATNPTFPASITVVTNVAANTFNNVGLNSTGSTAILNLGGAKTVNILNTLTLAGIDATTLTFQGTDTYVGRATTDVLTNKTFNCGSTGNVCTVRLGSDVTGQAPIANGGTGQATAAAAITALMPTPTRAGDIAYWNGSNWATLPGNNSGTLTLQENASGVPSWASVAGTGTVTSAVIAAGTGISVGGTCTITSSGTCTITNTGVTSVAGAGMASGSVTTTGNITVTAASKSDQQTGSSAVNGVTPLHQQDHDSAAKAWAVITPSTGAILKSYNVSGVVRNSAGNYTATFTTNFDSTSFACSAFATGSVTHMAYGVTQTASTFQWTTEGSSFAAADPGTNSGFHCFGRQ